MRVLDRRLLKKFLKTAGEDLTGDWVLIGGTVLPLLGVDHRATTDIDLIGLGKKEQAQTLKLMELAEKLGLPIEAINQAGAWFLSKIPDYRDHLVVLHEGPKARIFRPDLFLFLQLKIARLTESDLQDCLEFLKLVKKSKEPFDKRGIRIKVEQAIKANASPNSRVPKIERLEKLLRALLLAVLIGGSVSCSSEKKTPDSLPASPGSLHASPGSTPTDLVRSVAVAGTQGMVVADDRVAADWGVELLRQGGNAVDAAVGTAFVMAVTRPWFASLGGGGFLIFCPPKGVTCHALDYRETAPQAVDRDFFVKLAEKGQVKKPTDLSQNGALAPGVPGVPAGLLAAHAKFGKLSRAKIMSRAIELARRGFHFTLYAETAAYERWTHMNEAAQEIFGCRVSHVMRPCQPGTKIRQSDLARVLEEIRKGGKDGFYQGWVARGISAGLRSAGGVMTVQDLASYAPKWREPVRGNWRGFEVISMPPPSSGGVLLLQLLGYLDRADQGGAFAQGFASAPAIHAVAHGMSLAFADRATHFGDPDFYNFPMKELLSPRWLDARWKTFRPGKVAAPEGAGSAPGRAGEEPEHTTHLSVVDRDGGAVALTTTVNDDFGSGFVPPGTGIVMNNEMDDFSVSPGTPNFFGLVGSEANSIAPGKRPLSSMTPTIVRSLPANRTASEVRFVVGAQGGPKIITSVAQVLFNRVHFGMSLADAIHAPRFHHQWKPPVLSMEVWGYPEETREALRRIGWSLMTSRSVGKIHAIERRVGQGQSGARLQGVADPRAEGAAVPEE